MIPAPAAALSNMHAAPGQQVVTDTRGGAGGGTPENLAAIPRRDQHAGARRGGRTTSARRGRGRYAGVKDTRR